LQFGFLEVPAGEDRRVGRGEGAFENPQGFLALPAPVADQVPAVSVVVAMPRDVIGRGVQREMRRCERQVEKEGVGPVARLMLLEPFDRVIGDAAEAVVDPTSWEAPRIFSELQRIGDVDTDEMRRVFNLGIGMVVAVPPEVVADTVSVLDGHGLAAAVIGEVVAGPDTDA